jgi:antitoxin HicB
VGTFYHRPTGFLFFLTASSRLRSLGKTLRRQTKWVPHAPVLRVGISHASYPPLVGIRKGGEAMGGKTVTREGCRGLRSTTYMYRIWYTSSVGKDPKPSARKNRKRTDHSGSTFDSFLEQEGIREEVEAVAIKRVLAWQLSRAMQEQQKTKQAMAKQLHTSRSQLDRLLDPQNVSVTLDTITRAARALGKRVIIRVADVKTKRA